MSEPYKWHALAQYNGERDRGITHTPEWDAEMAKQQIEFNAERIVVTRSREFFQDGIFGRLNRITFRR